MVASRDGLVVLRAHVSIVTESNRVVCPFRSPMRFVPRFEATAAHMPCYQPSDNNTSRVAMHSINGRDHGPPSRPRPRTSWKVTELKHMPIANNPCASVDGVKKRSESIIRVASARYRHGSTTMTDTGKRGGTHCSGLTTVHGKKCLYPPLLLDSPRYPGSGVPLGLSGRVEWPSESGGESEEVWLACVPCLLAIY